MKNICFPTINLNLKINKIAFKIGNIAIYNYAVIIVLAIIAAFIFLYKNKDKFKIDFDFTYYTAIWCVIFGIIGARVYYILFNLKYYIENLNQIFNLRNGGLAIYGGIIAGLIVVIIRCLKNKIDICDFLDYIIPSVAIAQSIGRWGNFFNVEAYGKNSNNFLTMGIHTIEGYKEVHPVFLYESFFTFILFIILAKMQNKRKFKGQIVLIYLMMYSFVRFFLEKLRIDSLMFFSVRISSVISVIIFVICFGLYLKNIFKCRKMSKNIKKGNSKKCLKTAI